MPMMTGSWSVFFFPVCVACVRLVTGNGLAKLPPPDSNLNVYALPVGQGDCTVIQCPARSAVQHYTGHNYNLRPRIGQQLPTLLTVVDMGATPRRGRYMKQGNITEFLGEQIKYIEVVTISHPDEDHHNYIPTVLPLSKLQALRGVYIGCQKNHYSGSEYDELTTRGWLSAVENSRRLFAQSRCTTNCPAIRICGGTATLRMLGANLAGPQCNHQQRNSNSLVLRLEYGLRFKLLLPGDFQDISRGNNGVQRSLVTAWSNYGGIQADFYKLAHHGAYQGGSNTKTKANKDHFLRAVSPKYAFSSSAAPPNTYNHPHCGLYQRLVNLGLIGRVSNPQRYLTCGLERGKQYTTSNNYGIYSTSPDSDQPTIIRIATNGIMSDIQPVLYTYI